MSTQLVAMYRGKRCPVETSLPYARWPELRLDDGSLQAAHRCSFRALLKPGAGPVFDRPLDAPPVIPDGSTIRTEDHYDDIVMFAPRERVLPREGGWIE